jgi:outer membrane lipoprotein-sorting protein
MIPQKISIILLGLMMCCLSLNAQSIREDMEYMQAQYKGIKNLYVEMENKVYEGDKVVQEQYGKIYKKGDLYFYDFKENQLLVNSKHILIIDNRNKVIVYDKWSKKKAQKLAGTYIPNVDDMLERYPKVSFVGVEEEYKHYILENAKERMSKVETFFDPKTGYMKEVIYRYNPKLMTTNIYTHLKLNVIESKPSFENNQFSEKQFIKISNDRIVPVGKYSNYTIRKAN